MCSNPVLDKLMSSSMARKPTHKFMQTEPLPFKGGKKSLGILAVLCWQWSTLIISFIFYALI